MAAGVGGRVGRATIAACGSSGNARRHDRREPTARTLAEHQVGVLLGGPTDADGDGTVERRESALDPRARASARQHRERRVIRQHLHTAEHDHLEPTRPRDDRERGGVEGGVDHGVSDGGARRHVVGGASNAVSNAADPVPRGSTGEKNKAFGRRTRNPSPGTTATLLDGVASDDMGDDAARPVGHGTPPSRRATRWHHPVRGHGAPM